MDADKQKRALQGIGDAPIAGAETRRPRVSVVVPTYQRPELLRRCLGALRAQNFDGAGYEVIVADDGASETTRRLVEEFAAAGEAPAFRYLAMPRQGGPAAARNAGWRAALGEIIAFTDDDCIPDPCWLSAGVAAFRDGVAGVSGRLVMPLPVRPTDYEKDAAGLTMAEFATANCFYRRDALACVGGFDERFREAWREDSDLFFTMLERGHRLERTPEAVVLHPIRSASWGVALRQQRKSIYNALLFKKHPQLYRQRIAKPFPWLHHATNAAGLAALAGLLTGRKHLARDAGIAWLGLTARFCARRLHGTSSRPSHIAEMVVTSALIPALSAYWRLRGAARFRVWFA